MQFRIDAASGSLRISPSNLRKGDCAVMRQQQYVRYVRWSDEVGLDDLKSLWQKMMRILDGTNWDDSRVTAAVAVQLRKRSIEAVPLSSALIRNYGTSGSSCVSVFSLIWPIEPGG